MLTLLGSLLGFATSAVPDIMSLFRERADRRHELAVLDRQMEQMRLGHNQRLEEIEVNADIAESKALYRHDAALGGSSRWVDGLRASVRPLITLTLLPDPGPGGKLNTDLEGRDDKADEAAIFAGIQGTVGCPAVGAGCDA